MMITIEPLRKEPLWLRPNQRLKLSARGGRLIGKGLS